MTRRRVSHAVATLVGGVMLLGCSRGETGSAGKRGDNGDSAATSSGLQKEAEGPGASEVTSEQRKLLAGYLKEGGAPAPSAAPADPKLRARCKQSCEHTTKFAGPPDEGVGVGSAFGIDAGRNISDECARDCVRLRFTDADLKCTREAKSSDDLRKCKLAAELR